MLERYERLRRGFPIGNTPLVELSAPGMGNRLFVKLEYANHTGSHYDRVYLAILQALEREAKIVPGVTTLVETTSGNAGISCAFMARQLGYSCLIFAPASLPERRKELIRQHGAELRETDGDSYIEGAAIAMRQFLRQNAGNKVGGVRRFYAPNHSQVEISCEAMASLAAEALVQAGGGFDCFIGAAGNGTTLKGIGRVLKCANQSLWMLAFDPAASPVASRVKYGGEGIATSRLHGMYGAGAWGVRFPHLEGAVQELIDEVSVVEDAEWQTAQQQLLEMGYAVGPTSAAAYHLACRYCEGESNKRVFIIFYDQSDRY